MHSTTATASSISARRKRAVPSSRSQGSTAGSAPSPPGLQGCEQLPPASPALVHVTTFPEHTPEGVPGARDSGPQLGAAARRAPRHRAFAQMRVPEQSHPDSPTNFASCPPATAWGSKPRGCHRHATRGGDLAGVPTPGWKDVVDWHKSVWGLVRGREGRAHAHELTRAHTRAHAHARRGPLAAAPILRQGREAVTRATSAAVTSPEHHAGPGLRRARARLLRAAGCAAIGRGVCAATLSPAARRRGRPAGWGRSGRRRRGPTCAGPPGRSGAPPADLPRALPGPKRQPHGKCHGTLNRTKGFFQPRRTGKSSDPHTGTPKQKRAHKY